MPRYSKDDLEKWKKGGYRGGSPTINRPTSSAAGPAPRSGSGRPRHVQTPTRSSRDLYNQQPRQPSGSRNRGRPTSPSSAESRYRQSLAAPQPSPTRYRGPAPPRAPAYFNPFQPTPSRNVDRGLVQDPNFDTLRAALGDQTLSRFVPKELKDRFRAYKKSLDVIAEAGLNWREYKAPVYEEVFEGENPVDWESYKEENNGYQGAPGFGGFSISTTFTNAFSRDADPQKQRDPSGSEGDPLALLYGYGPHGGTIFFRRVKKTGSSGNYGKLVLGICWGMGPIESFEQLRYNDEDVPTAVTRTDYRGDPGDANYGVVDPDILDVEPTYADTLVATDEETGQEYAAAYSVITIPANLWQEGIPFLTMWIKGHPVYDPRTSQTAYSANAALIHADVWTHPLRGLGKTIDWTTVETAADDCEGVRKRQFHGALQSLTAAPVTLGILGEIASTDITVDGDSAKMVTLRDEAPIREFTTDDTARGFRIAQGSTRDVPDVVEVSYGAPDPEDQWRRVSKTIRAKRPGLVGNAHPYVTQRVNYPQITDADQAYQMAVRRLNRYRSDIRVSWVGSDEMLQYTRGNVVSITDDNGITNMRARITAISFSGIGRYAVQAVQDDAEMYSIEPAPVVPSMPPPWGQINPAIEEPPASVTVREELYSDETGQSYSRVKATWAPVQWPYARNYDAKITGAGVAVRATIAHQPEAPELEVVSGPIEQGQVYTAEIATVGSYGESAPTVAAVVAQGKTSSPAAPASASAVQVGEFVYVSWPAAQDDDVEGYAVRRGTTTQTLADWDSLTVVAAKSDQEYILESGVPLGSSRYFVRTVDSRYKKDNTPAGAYSVTAALADIEVEEGGTVARFQTRQPSISTAVEMTPSTRMGRQGYITDTGQTWGDRFNLNASWDSQNPDSPWAVPTGTKSGPFVETAEADFGEDISGVWARQLTTELIGVGGTLAVELLLADAASYPAFTTYTAGSAKANARYAKVRVLDTGPETAALAVRDDIVISVASEAAAEGNLITGGDFISFQEGTVITPSAAVIYAGDLFHVKRDNNDGGWTVSQQLGRAGGRAMHALRMQRTQGSTVDSIYRVSYGLETEEIALLRGSRVTIDAWVRTGVNFSSIGTTMPRARLLVNTTPEGNFDDIVDGGETASTLLFDGNDLPLISDGPNSWKRCTASFDLTIPMSAESMCVAIECQPAASDTAGADDWIEVTEWQLLRGVYTAANVLDFTTANVAATRARILRYLRFSESTGQAAEFSYQMRVTPSESGAGPYKYDARL